MVSVIIPCYNCSSFIIDTLNSLKEQTYKEIELICINDGSEDNTLELLNEYKQNNPELTLVIINQTNHGVSYTRNCGIKISKGEYIVFVDSDDIVNKRYVEILVNVITSKKTDTAYCRLIRDLSRLDYIPTTRKVEIQDQSKAMSYLLYRMSDFGFYCYIYKRKTLIDNNIFFDENTRRFEDREFNWKYLANCSSACFVDECLYGYRINEQSFLHQKINWTMDSIEAAMRVEKYLEAKKIPYYAEVKKYLVARVVWGMAKNYARAGEYHLLVRLGDECDVKSCMKVTAHDKNKKVALASKAYLVSPRLFYFLIGIAGV